MKSKIFLLRNLAVFIMLVLTLTSSVLALVMHEAISRSGQTTAIPWMIFGDALIPLILFIAALKFHNRYCSLAAILLFFINIFLRLFSIVIFRQSYMPFDYNSIKLLTTHTDFYALKAMLGPGYIYWLLPLIVIIAGGIIFCCVMGWKTTGLGHRSTRHKWVLFFSSLLLLSLISNLSFQVLQFCTTADNDLPVRPLPIIIMNMTQDAIKQFSDKETVLQVPLPEKSKQVLTELEIIAPTGTDHQASSVFDKIIIIAVESLDYDFIGCNNPQMPDNVTPHLDRLSTGYISMKNYFAATQPTNWGLNSIISSRPDYTKDRIIKPESIFSQARKYGYSSYYFSAASGHYGDNRRIYSELYKPDKIFFLEEFQKEYKFTQVARWGLSDNNLFQGVLDELKKYEDEKFIAVISTVDTHPPYYIHEEEDKNKKTEIIFDDIFLQTLHNTDREIGRFTDELMADARLFDDRTLLIITADHTATFGRNYLNRPDFTPGRVPLILICRNREIFSGLNTGKYASSIDLAPTLMQLMGADLPESFMGRNLFSAKNCAITWLLSNRALIYFRTPVGNANKKVLYIDLNYQEPQEDEISAAFRDFFQSFYGEPE